jgi:hypothetical protein
MIQSIYYSWNVCLGEIPTRRASCICYPHCVRAVRKEKDVAAKIARHEHSCVRTLALKNYFNQCLGVIWHTMNAGRSLENTG